MSDRDATRWLLVRGAVAVAGATVANALVLRAGLSLASLPPLYRPGAVGPLAVPAVAGVAATLVYRALDRRTREPYRAYVRAVGVGLVGSFVPVGAAALVFDLEPRGIALLATMHAVVALVLCGAFVPLGRSDDR